MTHFSRPWHRCRRRHRRRRCRRRRRRHLKKRRQNEKYKFFSDESIKIVS